MKYTVMSKEAGGYGNFFVIAADEREALTVATRLFEHGCDVKILGYPDGPAYEMADLERVLLEGKAA